MLEPATLCLAPDGTPFSEAYGDVYHTRTGGLGQACHVFLGGNDLPRRWQGRDGFVILETGFGLGLNFLATWATWRADPERSQTLHFISCEKHPFLRDDLQRAHALAETGHTDPDAIQSEAAQDGTAPPESSRAETQLAQAILNLADTLCLHWPTLTEGRHDIAFEEGRVRLTLLFGDASDTLQHLPELADAFFLDGFSPAKNPELWSAELLALVSQHAAPAASLATWSVASGVRHALADQGWQLKKTPGFRGKREMLQGRRSEPNEPSGE
ncbi:tRNA (5-methylaminomethyl-2-thiouridine)(34)-methyltransferase MnmD [Rhodocyclus gracilis]|uniref:tRNA (5-methylaminomethyl-2-thiouridine)(34)-methyltransferase MnmD n=1 Tax=Rhodocyclus gracilis TaxID=2929842 RepID=UPI0030FE6B57